MSELARFLEALQPGRMGPRLSALVGSGPQPCHVLDAKYEPGVRAIIAYDCGGDVLRGDLLPARSWQREHPSPGTVVLPGVRVCRFPTDPELPTLPEVVDPVRLGHALSDAVGTGSRSGWRRCRPTVLRYRPGKRATVLVRLVDGRGFVAKVYHDPAKAAAVAEESRTLAGTLTAHLIRSRTLRIACPVAHLPDLRVVVQHRVSGVPLDVVVASRPASLVAVEGIGRAAEALAELHALPPVTTRYRSVDRELVRFAQRAARVRSVSPRVGEELERLALRLRDSHDMVPPFRPGLVHGDCKPSQFLIHRDHVHLMDLDHLGSSDPAADVGTFLASLRQVTVRRSPSAPARDPDVDALRQAFLHAYCARGGAADRHRVLWQEAVALERKALRAFARAPGSPLSGALVAVAHHCLDDLGRLT